MSKNISFIYSSILSTLFMMLSLNLQASDCCECESGWFHDVRAEVRVAYYHPSAGKVRRIYGNGWADYQLELSKGFQGFGGLFNNCECEPSQLEWRIWAGVSGFSKKGHSIGFHDKTKLQLVPINLGLKVFYPIFCHTKVFIGGAACYSFLKIHDNSDYVKEHTRKQAWGGLIQSGITYDFCEWGVVSLFADYLFQHFSFHDKHYSSSYGSNDYYSDRYIERSNLNMSGYKIGAGLGITF